MTTDVKKRVVGRTNPEKGGQKNDQIGSKNARQTNAEKKAGKSRKKRSSLFWKQQMTMNRNPCFYRFLQFIIQFKLMPQAQSDIFFKNAN
jgi:hypothetical protein